MPLLNVSRQEFIARLQYARQQPVSVLPDWMQPGSSAAGSWPFPLFWSQLETIFHIGNWGIDHVVNPLLTLPPAKLDWVNGLLTWLGIRDASSDEEVCDLIEEWADEAEYPEPLWGAPSDTVGIPG